MCAFMYICLSKRLCTHRPAGLQTSPPSATTRMPILEGELVALDAFYECAVHWLIPDCPLALHTQVHPMAFDAQLQSMTNQHIEAKRERLVAGRCHQLDAKHVHR